MMGTAGRMAEANNPAEIRDTFAVLGFAEASAA